MKSLYDLVKARPEEFRQFSCRDLLFLKLDCPPSLKFDDWNEHNCFIHVLSGQKCFYTRDQSWNLQKGATFFIKRGAITIEKIGNEPLCALMFFVPDKYIRSFIKENVHLTIGADQPNNLKDKVLPVQNTPVMQAFYDSVLSYFDTNTTPAENLVELKFRELLLNITAAEENASLTGYFCKIAQPGTDDLQDIMEENFLYSMQLHEYARLCHRSLSKFKRDFFNVFTETPGRWLLQKRLEYACRMLITTEKAVADIAWESGFKNNTHFERVFKENYGIPPLKYRKHTRTVYQSSVGQLVTDRL
jgi:AraC family transcriptional regulator, exoenzyme S synthesis regulatory protein ExsA